MDPSGILLLNGLAVSNLFGELSRCGVGIQVLRVGEFKGAVNPSPLRL